MNTCVQRRFCGLPLRLEATVAALTKGSSREDGDVNGTWRMARSKLLHRPHIKVCHMRATASKTSAQSAVAHPQRNDHSSNVLMHCCALAGTRFSCCCCLTSLAPLLQLQDLLRTDVPDGAGGQGPA